MAYGFDFESNCYCDPISPTSDCNETPCTPFFAVFLPLHLLVFVGLLGFTILVEVQAKQRSHLWRIILCAGIVAEFAKVLRTGLMLNVEYRHSLATFLIALYNTHLYFATIAFISLLFFWARLYHDVLNKKLFGKLTPAYIVSNILIGIFFYGQLVAQSESSVWVRSLMVTLNGVFFFILSTVYIIYGFLLRKVLMGTRGRYDLFFKTFLSAFVSAILILLFIIEMAVSFITNFESTTDYLIKHSIYETLFISMFVSMPAGYISHYFKANVNVVKLPEEQEENLSSSKTIIISSTLPSYYTLPSFMGGCGLGPRVKCRCRRTAHRLFS